MTGRRPEIRPAGPVLDAVRPLELAAFYERFLGWAIARSEGAREGFPPEDGWALLRSPDGTRKLEVQYEPNHVAPVWPSSPGRQSMMMHMDYGADDVDEAVAWAIECGATLADHQPQPDVRVLLDPEGHPFCVFPDRD